MEVISVERRVTCHAGILFAAVRAENANMLRHQHVSTEKNFFFKRRKFPNKKNEFHMKQNKNFVYVCL